MSLHTLLWILVILIVLGAVGGTTPYGRGVYPGYAAPGLWFIALLVIVLILTGVI